MNVRMAAILVAASLSLPASAADCLTYEHAQKPWQVTWTESGFDFYLGPDRMAVCTESEMPLANGQVPLTCEGTTATYESWYELFPGADGATAGALLWGGEIYYPRCS